MKKESMLSNNRRTTWLGRMQAMVLAVTMMATVLAAWLGSVSSASAQAASFETDDTDVSQSATQHSILKQNVKTKVKEDANSEELQVWRSWVKDNAHAFSSIDPEIIDPGLGRIPENEFDDLQMLKPLLQSKRIVYLGESSHGVAQFNSAKTRLIQFLHQEMGYNVLAFESGLGDSAAAQGKLSILTAEEAMKQSIFPVWWAQETLPLFQYIKDTQSQKQPLRMTGFDMQDYKFKVEDWLEDAALVKKFRQVEKQLYESRDDLNEYQKVKPDALKTFKKIKNQLKASPERLKKAYPNEPHIVKIMERAFDIQIDVIDEYNELYIHAQTEAQQGKIEGYLQLMAWRDKVMAENLVWLAEEIYPTEKIIVWAHNDHIRQAQSEVEGSPFTLELMGELMPEEYQEQSYVLGLYMASGKSSDNQFNEYDVAPFERHAMESILSASEKAYTFIDVRNQRETRGNSWMFEPVLSYGWGVNPEVMEVREQYDGILLIDKVSSPNYIK